MKRRVRLAAAAVAVAVAVLAAGCSSSGGSTTNLKLSNDKPIFTSGYKAMSAVLSKQLKLTLNVNPYSDIPAFDTAITSGTSAGVKPPLFTWYTGQQLNQLVAAHQVAQTSSIWKQEIAQGILPASLEKYYTVNGQQYCIPQTLDYWGMYYNKKIFAKYGLSVPTTWTQLMNIAATLKAHGQTPFYEVDSTFAFVWFEMLLGQSDPNAYNELVSGKIPFTSAPVVKAMQQWASLIGKGYMSDPTITTNQQQLLADGKVAMVPSGTWLNSSFPSLNFPSSDYGFFLIPNVNPSLSKDVTFFETSPVCASPNASTTANAMKVLAWWDTTAPQQAWAKTELDISPNPKVLVPVTGFQTLDTDVQHGTLEPLERYYEAVPATVLTESLNDFSAFEVNPSTYMTQLQKIQKVAQKAFGGNSAS
ncbi:MAG TPA: extracellular solute-binding protein [Trebonia sp.]|jgi:ABC-type glycerol-3-phosphate transport system substrate-binding protein|nr:extracellular solute-binding protein [Trebonia sp.]